MLDKNVKVILNTVELHKENERKSEIELMNRDDIEDIIYGINLNDLAYEAFETARGYSLKGNLGVNIDARDGSIAINWSSSNSMTVGHYNTYINLFSIKTGDIDDYNYPSSERDWFVEDNHLNYYDKIVDNCEESCIMLNEYEIRDTVIEEFGLDFKKLQEHYFKIVDADTVEHLYDITHVRKQLDDLYENIID